MTQPLEPCVALPPTVLIPVAGEAGSGFPVNRVFCVGRNYADHAREMGGDPDREPPFFFMKPASAVTTAEAIGYPPCSGDLHHEVELVLMVGADAVELTPRQAEAVIWGCAVGLDLTRRDLQAEAKAAGRPWEAGKVFDGAAPCGAVRPGPPPDAQATIRLEVDGETRQQGRLAQMIYSPGEIVARLSSLFGLRAGDLIFTGTPAGVGPVTPGAHLRASIDGLPPLEVGILPPRRT